MLRIEREGGRFASLLLAQIFLVAVTPAVTDRGAGRDFLTLGVFGIMLAGLWAASERRRMRGVSAVLLLAAAWAWLGPDLLPHDYDDALRLATAALSFAFTSVVVLAAVNQHERVTLDTLLGGINVYLLLAFVFMMLHALLLVTQPDSYTVAGRSLRDELLLGADSHGFATLLYFSFTTLTTLGYGDIVPVGPFARLLTSAEAVIGQLYVAIFIGRLVGIEVSARQAARSGES